MPEIEIKIYPFGKSLKPQVLTKTDIKILLLRRHETIADLATRLPSSRENLSRVLNGKRGFSRLREKLQAELERMVRSIDSGGRRRAS